MVRGPSPRRAISPASWQPPGNGYPPRQGRRPAISPIFQSFTNTYAPAEQLRPLFTAAMEPEDVAVLSIATRPDCLPPGILELLADLAQKKPVWVELGLQTIHPKSAAWIRRGYELAVFDQAVQALKARGITGWSIRSWDCLGKNWRPWRLPPDTSALPAPMASSSTCSTSSEARTWHQNGRQDVSRSWILRSISPPWKSACKTSHGKWWSTGSQETGPSATSWLPFGRR